MKNIFLLLVLLFAIGQSCKTTVDLPESETENNIPESFRSKVLVSLMPEADVKDLEQKFAKYELKHMSMASKSKNQHLFSFDTSKISAEKLMKKLNKSKDVYLAEPLAFKMNKPTLMSSGEKKQIDIK